MTLKLVGVRTLSVHTDVQKIPGRQNRFRTRAVIYLGKLEVAETVFGGRRSDSEVLGEFRRAQGRWSQLEGWESAKRLGLF
jgi:hypothetical protein